MGSESPTNDDLQAQIDALVSQVRVNRSDIDSLLNRADASDVRADASELRADRSEGRADALDLRVDEIEARAQIDRDMIAELQRDGVLSQEHAAQMEEALRSSRVIGAAIGLIMGSRNMSQEEAFVVLQKASSNSNKKLRVLASELVDSASN